MFNESEIYSVAEVAKLLKCSRDTIYRLIKARDLKCVRVLTAIRICGWQLNDWIAENTKDEPKVISRVKPKIIKMELPEGIKEVVLPDKIIRNINCKR